MSELSLVYSHPSESQNQQLTDGYRLPVAAVSNCHIYTIPDEILFDILYQVFLDDVDDVWTISFTSIRLHRIAKQLLYSWYSTMDGVPGLYVRTLASLPNLQRCVQRVEWGANGEAFKFPEQPTTAELQHITERVGLGKVGQREATGKRRISKLNAWLMDGDREHRFNTFVLFTPNVRKIHVIPFRWSRKVVWFKPALESQIFSNLREALIGSEHVRIGCILSLFLLPSMRTLTVSYVGIHRDTDGMGPRHEWEANTAFWKRLDKDGSNLENLILPFVGGDTLDLVRVLESFKGLKKFKITFCGHGLGKDDVNVRTLLQAIANHRGSLASLDIDDPRLVNDSNALEELRVLDRLEWLQMSTLAFYGGVDEGEELIEVLPGLFKNLPRHIKHLHIPSLDADDVPEFFVEALTTMAPTINTIFPNLEKIIFSDWHPQLGMLPCQQLFAALQNGLAKAGVEAQSVHNTDGSADRWYEESRVAVSTVIEPDWVWVELLGGWADEDRDESSNTWFQHFGRWGNGNELERDGPPLDRFHWSTIRHP